MKLTRHSQPEYGFTTPLYRAAQPPHPVRQLFNKAVGVQKGNRFSFSFETEEEANEAFHYIAELGTLETSQPALTKEVR